MSDEQKRPHGRLNRLESALYSRTKSKSLGIHARRELSPEDNAITSAWSENNDRTMPVRRKKKSLLNVVLAIAVLFFLLSLAVAGFFFLGGTNIVSSQNVTIDVKGPVAIAGGEELTLQIAVRNRNTATLESADVIVEYPSGTRSSSNLEEERPRERIPLSRLSPGEQKEAVARAVLFGPEGSEATIRITVEFRVEGSNAIFFAEESYSLILNSSPLSLTAKTLSEATSGQEVSFEVEVRSNATEPIENVLLVAEYPFGFEYRDASTKPFFGNNVWNIGNLAPGGARTITIRGVLVAEDGEERVFRFEGGIQSSNQDHQIEVAFVTALESITVTKPFLSVDLALNGNTGESVNANSDEVIRADITWQNNLPGQISNAEIEARLSGTALDRRSVSVQKGFYRSIDDTIIWSPETESSLSSLAPGQSGRVGFTLSSLDLAALRSFQNPTITINISVKGRRVAESNVPETINSMLSRTVKINSDLILTSRALHYSGPFENSGPMPPRAEAETTYTIVWTITNTTNTASNASVIATLPSYVRYLNQVSPADESLTHNPVGGRLLWSVGMLTPGARREIAFQIAFLPSLSQVDTTPVLVREQGLTGEDQFTSRELRSERPPLTTNLSTDPQFDSREARVVE